MRFATATSTVLAILSLPAALSAQDSDPQRFAVCYDDRGSPNILTKVFTLSESQTRNLDTRVTRLRYGDWERLENDRGDAKFAECSVSDTRDDTDVGFDIQHDIFMEDDAPFQITDYRFERAALSAAAMAERSRAEREAAWQRTVDAYLEKKRENDRLQQQYADDKAAHERELAELDDIHRNGRARQREYERLQAEYERKKAENDAQQAAYEAQMREYRRKVAGD